MSLDRNAIYDALFALGQASYGWAYTSRRLLFWDSTPAQPALFLRAGDDAYPARDVRRPRVEVTLHAEFWIYYNTTDKDEAPGIMLDTLITALEDGLRPPGFADRQNLGLPYVSHCWIEGDIIKDDGALTGQAGARIPVKILAIS
jgi:hypothetical protein